MRHHPSPHSSPWSRLGLLVLLVLLVAITWLASACDGDSGNAVPLQITAQPADTAVVAGTAATLSVQAQGDNVGDQWQCSSNGGTSGVDIAGATSARWVSPTANLADDGTR